MSGHAWAITIIVCGDVILAGALAYWLTATKRKKNHRAKVPPLDSPNVSVMSCEAAQGDSIDHDADKMFDKQPPTREAVAEGRNQELASVTAVVPTLISTTPGQHFPENLMPYDRSPKSGPDELKTGQRGRLRCPYKKVELIAAYDTRVPSPGEFREIMCHDISAQEISFYYESPPDFRRAVIALVSSESDERYMVIEIVRTSPAEHDGRKMVLVGCRFVSRLADDIYPDGLQAARLELGVAG